MTHKVLSLCSGLGTGLMLAAVCAVPAAAQSSGEDEGSSVLLRMLAGESEVQGAELEAALEAASAHPLGSAENPVRAEMPQGQRAYLSRLRCANLKRPEYERQASAGMSPYGNIVDVYLVTCEGSEPASRRIYIDMYHRGHIETRAVEGYGIVSATAD